MDKPIPPDGTYKDWLRYRYEYALWDYFRRLKPLLDKEVRP